MRNQVFLTSEYLGSAAIAIIRPVSFRLMGIMACFTIGCSVTVCAQSEVEADATILILEAMKMETEIKAPSAGIIARIFVKPGDTVKPGTPLFEIQS